MYFFTLQKCYILFKIDSEKKKFQVFTHEKFIFIKTIKRDYLINLIKSIFFVYGSHNGLILQLRKEGKNNIT